MRDMGLRKLQTKPVPWYLWRFPLEGLFAAGLLGYLAWLSWTDWDEPAAWYLNVIFGVIFTLLAAWILKGIWRDRKRKW